MTPFAGPEYRDGAETPPPPNFEKVSEFFSERFSQRWMPKPQFWYPPLRFGSQHLIPKPLFSMVFWVYTVVLRFSAWKQ